MLGKDKVKSMKQKRRIVKVRKYWPITLLVTMLITVSAYGFKVAVGTKNPMKNESHMSDSATIAKDRMISLHQYGYYVDTRNNDTVYAGSELPMVTVTARKKK